MYSDIKRAWRAYCGLTSARILCLVSFQLNFLKLCRIVLLSDFIEPVRTFPLWPPLLSAFHLMEGQNNSGTVEIWSRNICEKEKYWLSRNTKMLKYWISEMLKFWYFELLKYWNTKMLKCSKADELKFWNVEMPNCWN